MKKMMITLIFIFTLQALTTQKSHGAIAVGVMTTALITETEINNAVKIGTGVVGVALGGYLLLSAITAPARYPNASNGASQWLGYAMIYFFLDVQVNESQIEDVLNNEFPFLDNQEVIDLLAQQIMNTHQFSDLMEISLPSIQVKELLDFADLNSEEENFIIKRLAPGLIN